VVSDPFESQHFGNWTGRDHCPYFTLAWSYIPKYLVFWCEYIFGSRLDWLCTDMRPSVGESRSILGLVHPSFPFPRLVLRTDRVLLLVVILMRIVTVIR